MAKSLYKIGDKVTVNFPLDLDDTDRAVGVMDPGKSHEAIIDRGAYEYGKEYREKWWTVRFVDSRYNLYGYPCWTCREKWFSPKDGPW